MTEKRFGDYNLDDWWSVCVDLAYAIARVNGLHCSSISDLHVLLNECYADVFPTLETRQGEEGETLPRWSREILVIQTLVWVNMTLAEQYYDVIDDNGWGPPKREGYEWRPHAHSIECMDCPFLQDTKISLDKIAEGVLSLSESPEIAMEYE